MSCILVKVTLILRFFLLEKKEQMISCQKGKWLFSLSFFDRFSIIIIACGHYQRNYKFDIEAIFNVKWHGETVNLSRGNWFNIHYSTNSENTRIVIHARQFSNGVSKELINSIAEKCNEFASNNMRIGIG